MVRSRIEPITTIGSKQHEASARHISRSKYRLDNRTNSLQQPIRNASAPAKQPPSHSYRDRAIYNCAYQIRSALTSTDPLSLPLTQRQPITTRSDTEKWIRKIFPRLARSPRGLSRFRTMAGCGGDCRIATWQFCSNQAVM